MDTFDKEYMSEHMATVEFQKQVRAALKPDGLLLANTYTGTRFQAHEEATYQQVHGTIYESRLDNGNRIILAGPQAPAIMRQLRHGRVVSTSQARTFTDRFAPANALLIH